MVIWKLYCHKEFENICFLNLVISFRSCWDVHFAGKCKSCVVSLVYLLTIFFHGLRTGFTRTCMYFVFLFSAKTQSTCIERQWHRGKSMKNFLKQIPFRLEFCYNIKYNYGIVSGYCSFSFSQTIERLVFTSTICIFLTLDLQHCINLGRYRSLTIHVP
jgi:hypothetical protein